MPTGKKASGGRKTAAKKTTTERDERPVSPTPGAAVRTREATAAGDDDRPRITRSISVEGDVFHPGDEKRLEEYAGKNESVDMQRLTDLGAIRGFKGTKALEETEDRGTQEEE